MPSVTLHYRCPACHRTLGVGLVRDGYVCVRCPRCGMMVDLDQAGSRSTPTPAPAHGAETPVTAVTPVALRRDGA